MIHIGTLYYIKNRSVFMFIARQPFSTNLWKSSAMNSYTDRGATQKGFDGTSSSHATASVIGGLFESGIDQIVDDKRAFINFDAAFIGSDLPEAIIEVLEDVVVNEDLILRIKNLKSGYPASHWTISSRLMSSILWCHWQTSSNTT